MSNGLRTPVRVMSTDEMADRIEELEAKLAVAVEFISNLKQYAVAIDDRRLHGKAVATLAELKGGKKDGTV